MGGAASRPGRAKHYDAGGGGLGDFVHPSDGFGEDAGPPKQLLLPPSRSKSAAAAAAGGVKKSPKIHPEQAAQLPLQGPSVSPAAPPPSSFSSSSRPLPGGSTGPGGGGGARPPGAQLRADGGAPGVQPVSRGAARSPQAAAAAVLSSGREAAEQSALAAVRAALAGGSAGAGPAQTLRPEASVVQPVYRAPVGGQPVAGAGTAQPLAKTDLLGTADDSQRGAPMAARFVDPVPSRPIANQGAASPVTATPSQKQLPQPLASGRSPGPVMGAGPDDDRGAPTRNAAAARGLHETNAAFGQVEVSFPSRRMILQWAQHGRRHLKAQQAAASRHRQAPAGAPRRKRARADRLVDLYLDNQQELERLCLEEPCQILRAQIELLGRRIDWHDARIDDASPALSSPAGRRGGSAERALAGASEPEPPAKPTSPSGVNLTTPTATTPLSLPSPANADIVPHPERVSWEDTFDAAMQRRQKWKDQQNEAMLEARRRQVAQRSRDGTSAGSAAVGTPPRDKNAEIVAQLRAERERLQALLPQFEAGMQRKYKKQERDIVDLAESLQEEQRRAMAERTEELREKRRREREEREREEEEERIRREIFEKYQAEQRRIEEERQRAAEEERRRVEEEERLRLEVMAQYQEERQRLEEEERVRREEERRVHQEIESLKRKAWEDEQRRVEERRRAEEEERQRMAEELRRVEEEEAARRVLEAKRREEEERLRMAEELQRLEEEEAARQALEAKRREEERLEEERLMKAVELELEEREEREKKQRRTEQRGLNVDSALSMLEVGAASAPATPRSDDGGDAPRPTSGAASRALAALGAPGAQDAEAGPDWMARALAALGEDEDSGDESSDGSEDDDEGEGLPPSHRSGGAAITTAVAADVELLRVTGAIVDRIATSMAAT